MKLDEKNAVCRKCGEPGQLDYFGTCTKCAREFREKVESVTIISEPWGLKEARRGGFANQ